MSQTLDSPAPPSAPTADQEAFLLNCDYGDEQFVTFRDVFGSKAQAEAFALKHFEEHCAGDDETPADNEMHFEPVEPDEPGQPVSHWTYQGPYSYGISLCAYHPA